MFNKKLAAFELPPVAPELEVRLANYGLDDGARALIRKMAPTLEPLIDSAIDRVIAGAARCPMWPPFGPSMAKISNVLSKISSADCYRPILMRRILTFVVRQLNNKQHWASKLGHE